MFGVYIIGIYITVPIPGIDPEAIGDLTGFLGLASLFGGGALKRLSIFSLGLNPYITSSIIMQLMTVAIPSLKKEEQEGGQYARMKKAQRTRFLTIVLCLFQGWGVTQLFKGEQGGGALAGLDAYGMISMILIWTAGAMLVLWIGEQIQEKGIGQGVSLMIFAGIIVSIPQQVGVLSQEVQDQTTALWQIGLLLLIFVFMTVLIVFFTQAQRRINIQHMRRTVGTKVMGGGSSFLPIPVNAAGVIPIIFGISLIFIPSQFAGFMPNNPAWSNFWNTIALFFNPTPGAIWYYWVVGTVVYAALIFFFTYFWVAIQFNVEDIANNLKRGGSYIPGVRQGKQTEVFLDGVISRVTVVGALFLAFVAIVPYWIPQITRITSFQLVGGTSLLIVVSVVLDLMRQVEANLIMRGYSK